MCWYQKGASQCFTRCGTTVGEDRVRSCQARFSEPVPAMRMPRNQAVGLTADGRLRRVDSEHGIPGYPLCCRSLLSRADPAGTLEYL